MLFVLGLTASLLAPTGLAAPQNAGDQTASEVQILRERPQTPLPNVNRAPDAARTPSVPEAPRQRLTSGAPAPTRESSPPELSEQDLRAAGNASAADRHSRLYFDEVNGTHWIRGKSYKASASTEGFTYIPFLGSDAPQNFPVQMRLTSVERSGAAMDLTPSASVRREGNRMVLDRGPVQVWYDMDLEQVEQSFAFTAPSGTGDVTLTLDVSTELQGAQNAGAFRFSNEFGAVTYSEAIVLDAAGRSASVPTRLDQGTLQLTVPAAFIDTAAGPIVVDPIFGTEIVDDFTADLRRPDLAYDAELDRYLAVYEEEFSAGDFDVYSQFITPSPFAVSGGTYIDSTDDNWVKPKVAQQRNTRRFLVVAEADSSGVAGSTDIAARFRLADGTLEPQFILKGATSTYGCQSPDIGSEAGNFVSSYYCVAYNRDYGTDRDVTAILVDTAGNFFGPEIALASVISRDEGVPAVSKSITNSGYFNYVVAWPVEELNTDEGKVEAREISFSGSTVSSAFDITPFTSTTMYFDVAVSNHSDRDHPVTLDPYYVVSYDDSASIVTDALLALCSGQTVHSTEQLQVIEHHPRGANENAVAIGTFDEEFVFAYEANDELFLTIAQPIGNRLGMTERRISNGTANPSFGQPLGIATTTSGGSDLFTDGLVLWSGFDGTSSNIYSAFFTPPGGPDAAGTQYCYGAPNSTGDHGYMLGFGNRDRFSPQTLVADSLPPNAFGFYLASTTQGSVPGAGGSQGTLCVVGSVGRFGIFNSGTAGRGVFTLNPQAIAQPTGSASALSGQTWNFQTWHRDAVSGTATSNFTNAVAIRFL